MKVRIKNTVFEVIKADAIESDGTFLLTIKPSMAAQIVFIQWGMPYTKDVDGNWEIEVMWNAIDAMFDFNYE